MRSSSRIAATSLSTGALRWREPGPSCWPTARYGRPISRAGGRIDRRWLVEAEVDVEDLLGNSLSVFIGVTVIIFGFASFMTGQALAGTWRPIWQVFPYC